MARSDPETLATMHQGANDPWASRRRSDPVLRAVLTVLRHHTDVAYYTVDWRPFLFGATCPMEQDGLARGLVQSPGDICGSHSLPYDEGGGGYLERFAQHLGAKATETGKRVSDVIVDELREDYDREVWVRSPDNTSCHLGGRNGARPRMSFEEILTAAHWTPGIFDAIDTEVAHEHDRQAEQQIIARGRPAGPVRMNPQRPSGPSEHGLHFEHARTPDPDL